MNLVYNERSWAIDLISELNSVVKNQNLQISRASGEAGLRNTKGFLFPDAIIYGRNSNILMGWELKMPDTPIEDQEFFDNAEKKANLLGTNSFLLWNGKSAKLFVRKQEDFLEIKSWHESRLVDRKTMGQHQDYWQILLRQIIQDLEFFISTGEIPASKIAKILDENFIIEIIDALFRDDSKVIKNEYQRNIIFRSEFDAWSHENGFGKKDERFEELAKLNILSWINRLMFSHYLASKTPKARLIYSMTAETSIEEAIEIFQEITNELNFSQIFKPGIGNDLISETGWRGRMEINDFLSSANLTELPDDIFRKVLDNFAESAKRKAMGQYATPKLLARLLVRLTMNDATGNFLDPCVGSGTFVKEAHEFRKELDIESADSFETLWASDKYQLPLQITTLNLLDEGLRISPLQIFKADVFSITPSYKVELVDPHDFTKSSTKSLPMMKSIVSNLPFIRFESTDSRGPAEVAEEVFSKTQLPAAKRMGKADVYASIIFQLWPLLEDGGSLGVVVSNSWMGTDWGKSFQEIIKYYFDIETVVRSGKRRWFNNADIVTNLLILKKKDDSHPLIGAEINFVTTLIPLEDWNDSVVDLLTVSIIQKRSSDKVRVNCVTEYDQSVKENAGYSIRSNFYECGWVSSFIDQSIPLGDLFEVARGARRGWNPLFYPANTSKIESEFLIPALKSTARQTFLLAQPDGVAFCCEESLDDLKNKNKLGAFNWVKNFESQVNGNGDPLPEVLAQPDFFWYQMSSKEKANFVISMNPYENLSFLQLEPAAFVDQRLIRLNPKVLSGVDLELLHALLNCSLSLLGIELLGFERGLGVLDISATSLKKHFRILDPSKLNDSQKNKIKEQFRKLKSRPMKSTLEEILEPDRQVFDELVLSAYALENHKDEIYSTLQLAISERVNC